MSLPRIIGIGGNVRRPSRTRALIEEIVAATVRAAPAETRIFDLIDAGPGLGAAWTRRDLTPEALAVVEAIEGADALVVGTPVYKGAYTGLFKHLFDFVDPQALDGVPVVLTATGGGPKHALVVEHSLRPLFGFFNALAVPTAVYAGEADIVDGTLANPVVRERAHAAARQLAQLIRAPAAHAALQAAG
jgi:FMN reductase